MSDELASQSEAQSAMTSLVIQYDRQLEGSSRLNFGLTAENYNARDALANEPKQAGSNGVLKGADDALEDESPYREGANVSTAVPGR
jgi:hypothetical protein